MLNVKPSTIFTGDNLDILRGMEGKVDLIYLDPPFNSNRSYAAPIGSEAAGVSFEDSWHLDDYTNNWLGLVAKEYPALVEFLRCVGEIKRDRTKVYLIYMAVRLIEMKRLLKKTGSIYLHCDPTASHYLKVVMDAIFGKKNCRNEIVWSYPASPSSTKRDFPRKHDTILHYSMSNKSTFNADDVRIPTEKSTVKAGTDLAPNRSGKIPPAVWQDISQVNRKCKEYTGYPTQKPLALLQRIIRANSNQGDLVLDPFCGCATTCVAAQMEGRKWIGIDISPKAYDLAVKRFRSELGHENPEIIHSADIPHREAKQYEDIKLKLYGRQEGYCNGCNHPFPFSNLAADYVTPLAADGFDGEGNMQLLCKACKSAKGMRTMKELKSELRRYNKLPEW